MRVRSCVFAVSELGLGVSKFGLGEQIGASDAAVWSMIVCARGAAAVVPMLPASVLSFGLKNEALLFLFFSLSIFLGLCARKTRWAILPRCGCARFYRLCQTEIGFGRLRIALAPANHVVRASHVRCRLRMTALSATRSSMEVSMKGEVAPKEKEKEEEKKMMMMKMKMMMMMRTPSSASTETPT